MRDWWGGLLVPLLLAALFLVGILMFGCTRALPHRAVNELTNWGQGRVPADGHCPPGTVPYYLDDDTFLECMR
jgi:hypothetical protein